MHKADGDRTIKILARAPIAKSYFPVAIDRNALPLLAVLFVRQKEFHYFRIKNVLIFLLKLGKRRVDIVICHL